jgi:ComF family protein
MLVDALLPARCSGCGAPHGWPMCEACASQVTVITPPWCARCGRPSREPVAGCPDCPPAVIDLARSPFLYEGPVAAAIKGMKLSGWHGLAEHLAGAMAVVSPTAEAITWVPLSRRRLARRGFDQAELLARRLAARLQLPVRGILDRRRETRAQARRGGADRRRALAGAFRARGTSPRAVLLVDDVLTTGATAAAAAAALREAGAERVVLATAARSVGDPPRSGRR